MKFKLSTALLLLLLAVTPQAVYAWNGFGHMAVGYLAFEQLDQTTKDRVVQLLKKNPYYTNRWRTQMRDIDAEKGALLCALAGKWPDDFRSQSTKDSLNDSTDEGDPRGGYDDEFEHENWHYINVPITTDGSWLPSIIKEPNAKMQIARLRGVLRSTSASDEVKSYCLVWLIHLVGDVHQPLHAVARVTQNDGHGDRGGVAVKINGRLKTLHKVWDAAAGEDRLEDVPDFVAALAVPASSDASVTDARVWIDESVELAKSEVYKYPVKNYQGPFTLDAAYRDNAHEVAKKRVALAAHRLAEVLKQDLN